MRRGLIDFVRSLKFTIFVFANSVFLDLEASLEVAFLLVGKVLDAFPFCFGTLEYPIASIRSVLELCDSLLLCLEHNLSFCGENVDRLVV